MSPPRDGRAWPGIGSVSAGARIGHPPVPAIPMAAHQKQGHMVVEVSDIPSLRLIIS
jgi:hypothetical protein